MECKLNHLCALRSLYTGFITQQTRQDLLGKISFKVREINSVLLGLISNTFYYPNIGNTDDRFLSSVTPKLKKYRYYI